VCRCFHVLELIAAEQTAKILQARRAGIGVTVKSARARTRQTKTKFGETIERNPAMRLSAAC